MSLSGVTEFSRLKSVQTSVTEKLSVTSFPFSRETVVVMLDPWKINDFVLIAQRAIDIMIEDGYKEDDISIQSIVWDDDGSEWLVSFYCETSNLDEVTLRVEPGNGVYIYRGRVS